MGAELLTWAAAIPALLVSALVLWVPGLAVGALIRLRGLWLAAVAPAISMTLLGIASVVLSVAGLSWSPLPVLGFLVVSGAAIVVLFWLITRKRAATPAPASVPAWPAIVACSVAGLLLAFYAVRGIGAVENISQTFDNIFHLNTIAEITRSGSASPLTVGSLIAPDGGASFYPDGWHAVVQLVSQLAAAPVPVAINAFNVVVAASVWSVGIVLLGRQFGGNTPVVTLASGVFAAAFPVAPLLLVSYGVLYPYFLGVALAPVLLALVVNLLGLSREPRVLGTVPAAVLLAGLLPGISLAHPGAMMVVLAFSVPLAIIAAFAGWRSATTRGRVLRLAGLAAFLLVGLAMLYKLRPGVVWGPRVSPLRAAWETVTLSLGGYGLPLVAALLMLLGIVVALLRLNRTHAAALGMWVVAAALFFITAGVPGGILRGPTGVWYGDTPRLSSVYPIAVIPLAVVGTAFLVDLLTRSGTRKTLITSIVLAALLVGTQLTAGFGRFVSDMRDTYASSSKSALLSPDEERLLAALPDLVPEDAMIAGNPWTGTSLAYALAGRQVVFPHVFVKEINEDRSEVMDHLKEASPEACDAAERLGVDYVLDFGAREVHGGKHKYPGIEGLENSPSFELVAAEGDAKLYRLVACG